MQVDFSEVYETLTRVRSTLASDATVEIYTFLCFREGKVTSFNGATGTITKSGLDDLGDFCVDGKKFFSIIQAVRGQKGQLTFADGWIFLKADNFKTKLPVYDPDNFPDIEPSNTNTKICEATNVLDALSYAMTFVEKDANKEQITGIGFEKGLVYATDGKRVVQAELSSPVPKPFTLSKQAADQMIRLGDPDYLFRSEGNLGAVYSGSETVIVSRRPTADFPFHFASQVFAQPQEIKFLVPEGFRAAVDRVRSFSEDDEGVILLIADGYHLKISTAATETGVASDVVPLTSKPFNVKLKGSKLGTLLAKLRPSTADITDLVQGDGRMILFSGEGFQCAFAAMI